MIYFSMKQVFIQLFRYLFSKKLPKSLWIKNNPHLCNDFHFEQADSTANIAVGIFMPMDYHIVPSRVER